MTAEARARALASGLSPLEYLLEVMRDADQPVDRRLDAAKAAAPYVHSKLSPAPPPVDEPEQPTALTIQIIEADGRRSAPISADEWFRRKSNKPPRLRSIDPGS